MAGPERIDRFEVEAVLGAGAFATVWLARDPVLDLRVAIKVLADNWSRDPDIRRRFIEEARVLWQANSHRIVRVHHVSELPDGRPFFVMTWADRGTLRQRMEARFEAGTTFAVSEACSIMAEVARAIDDVHNMGRMHRDIKPGNILIRSSTAKGIEAIHGLVPDEQLVLADFGLARQIEASAITLVSGSPAYVAPEQASGLEQLSERADLFPIGLMAIELMTGSTPSERGTMAEAASTGEIDISGHLARCGVATPPDLRDFFYRLTNAKPELRPASASEVAATLAHFSAATYSASPAQVIPPPFGTSADATGQSGQVQSGQVQSGQVQSGQVQSGQVQSGQFHSGPVQSGQFHSGPAQSGQVPGPANSTSFSGGQPVGQNVNPQAQTFQPLPTGQGYESDRQPTAFTPGHVSDSPEKSKTGLFVGAGAIAVAAIAGVAFLLVSNTGGSGSGPDDIVAEVTTTSSGTPLPEDSVPIATLAVNDEDLQPIPLPDDSVLKSDDADSLRTLANVARSVDDLVTFYQSVDDPEWEIGEVSRTDDQASFEMTSATRTASVTLRPTAIEAGDGITQIEAIYRTN